MERNTRQLSRGYAALFASIAIWSMPSLFQFYLVRYYEPFAQNFYRYSVACLAIAPFVFYRVRRGGTRRRPRLWRGKQRTEDSEDEFHIRGRRSGGQKLGVKSDAFLGGFGRRDQLFDRGKHDGKLLIVFLFECFDFAGKVAVCIHDPAQLNECPHDGDVDLDRARAAQYAREHGDALLGESIWAISPSTVFARTHHSL